MHPPNAPLWVFSGATIVRLALHPGGVVGTAVTVVATVAIVAWAAWEIGWGVNPFRRILGGVILAWQALALQRH